MSNATNANLGALAFAQLGMSAAQISGGTLGVSLGTSSTQILGQLQNIKKVTFHNPGSVNIYVCQAFDMNGNALVAGALPGNFVIYPGAMLPFTGNGVAGAWLGAAASGTGNPLTIAPSQTL